jgi:hypothetical protein
MNFSVFWLPSINIERKRRGRERNATTKGLLDPRKEIFFGGLYP